MGSPHFRQVLAIPDSHEALIGLVPPDVILDEMARIEIDPDEWVGVASATSLGEPLGVFQMLAACGYPERALSHLNEAEAKRLIDHAQAVCARARLAREYEVAPTHLHPVEDGIHKRGVL